MWICILSGRPFEKTHDNAQWRKVKQMQPMWLCIFSGRQFEDAHAIQKSRKIPVFYFQKSRYRYLSPIPVYRYFPVYRRGLLVTSKPRRTNEPRRELGQRPRPKKGRECGMQWLKWSSLRGTGASAQASTGRECTGSRGQISNFVRRECELLAPPHQQLAGEQHGHYNWNATLQFWTNQTQTKCYKPWNIGLKLLTCSLGSLGPPDL